MGIFDSPREREGPGAYRNQLGRYDRIIGDLGNLPNEFGGINSLSDLFAKYGLSPFSSNTFAPAKRALGTSQARSRAALTDRLGGQSANPEFAFSGLEGGFSGAYSNLLGEEQQAKTGMERFNAGFLGNILGQKQGANERRTGMTLSAEQARANAVRDYIMSLSGASTMDDILGIAGTVAKFFPDGD